LRKENRSSRIKTLFTNKSSFKINDLAGVNGCFSALLWLEPAGPVQISVIQLISPSRNYPRYWIAESLIIR